MENETSTRPLPYFFIGQALTAERINNYLTQKHPLLSQGLGRTDTKSVWYSKEHIVKLLEELEYAGGDGVRVSFGVYEPSNEYAGQLCLLMNLTRERIVDGIVLHENVLIENEPDFPERSTLARDIIELPGEDEPIDKDFNYGMPCPPRC
jgi:hypothetical protein